MIFSFNLFKKKRVHMVKLGEKVRDKITGLEGIAIGRHEWLHGCVRISIQPQEVKDGKPAEVVCLDEPQLDVIAEKTLVPSPTTGPGGPHSEPGQRSAPSRR